MPTPPVRTLNLDGDHHLTESTNDVQAGVLGDYRVDVRCVCYTCPDELRRPQPSSAGERIPRDDLLFPDRGGLQPIPSSFHVSLFGPAERHFPFPPAQAKRLVKKHSTALQLWTHSEGN